jgi:hypothetical protein
MLIYFGPIDNNLLTHMDNLRNEEHLIRAGLLYVNAGWGDRDKTVASKKQSFPCALRIVRTARANSNDCGNTYIFIEKTEQRR